MAEKRERKSKKTITKPSASKSAVGSSAKKAKAGVSAGKKAGGARPVRQPEKKQPAKPAPRQKEIKPLTAKEIERYRQLLIERRQELIGNVSHMRGEALDNNRHNAAGDLSNMPIHMADIGTDNYEQEFALELLESERKMLAEIDRALAKIANGTYGICEATGQTISRSRLDAIPEARYTIEYCRLMEKGRTEPASRDRDIDSRTDYGVDIDDEPTEDVRERVG